MKVPLQIVFRNLKPSVSIMARIRRRVAWLEHYHEPVISCRVAVQAPHKHHQKGNLFQIRIDLRVPGEEIVVSRRPDLRHAHEDLGVALNDAFDETRRRLEEYARRRRRHVRRDEAPPRGRVVRLVRQSEGRGGGYGFLRTEDGRDLYFQDRSVLGDRYDLLKIGTPVRYSEELGEEGPQASTVAIVHARIRRAA